MNGSSFGHIFKVTTWGESHGPAIGCIIDGVPSGIALSEDDFIPFMEARKTGKDCLSSSRKEPDKVNILSGIYKGMTTGTPISLLIKNTDIKSQEYIDLLDGAYRPGHADFSYDTKFGIRDPRGGGRSSGRETAMRVAAGVVARKILNSINISISSEYSPVPDNLPEGDSVGGKVKVTVSNVPAGLGEPVFDKLDAILSHGFFSVGAVKAVEIGDGIKVSESLGSENNDSFALIDGKIAPVTNHSGGILGGISTGADIVITAHIKPTPTIGLEQTTVNGQGETKTYAMNNSRHDKYLPPRIAPVLEAMAAITVADSLLENMTSKIEYIEKLYK